MERRHAKLKQLIFIQQIPQSRYANGQKNISRVDEGFFQFRHGTVSVYCNSSEENYPRFTELSGTEW